MTSKTKFKSGHRIVSAFMAVLLVFTLMFSMTAMVSAETVSNEKVKEVGNSVLQIETIYQPKGEDDAIVQLGSCFLINSTTVLTAAHLFEENADLMAQAEVYYGRDHKFSEDNFKSFEVLVNGGVSVKATLKKKNPTADYAILKLDETINRPFATLGASENASVTQPIYTVGFPYLISSLEDSKTHTTDHVTITSSTISNIPTVDGVDFLVHNANQADGVSGGALVDENGLVIGVCVGEWNDGSKGSYAAVEIDQIKAALDDLDIEYTAAGSVGTATTALEETTAATTATEATTAPIEATQAATEPAKEGGLDTTQFIIIIAIVVLLIVVIVVVILIVMSNKRKSAEKIPTSSKGSTVMPGPGVPPQNGMGAANRPSQPPYGQPYNRPSMPPQQPQSSVTVPSNEGGGETSVLNDGAGETTVLGNQSTGYTMMRKRNNEKIVINKPEFVIGKERRRVDYCISDNNSVSRTHAKIKVRAGRCYIADLGSTNCTYVNGSKLSPNQEVILSKGDQIKISDEEFEFMG